MNWHSLWVKDLGASQLKQASFRSALAHCCMLIHCQSVEITSPQVILQEKNVLNFWFEVGLEAAYLGEKE